MSDFDKFIKILKLSDSFSEEELKKAYRKAVIKNHPDKFQDAEEKKRATERMKKINEAYEYLKDYTQTDYKDDTEDNYDTDYADDEYDEDDENYNDETDYQHSERNRYTENENKSSSTNNANKKKTSSFSDLIKILEYAINTQSQVKIKYINRMNQVSERVILPFEIVHGLYEKDKIYLIAYCLVKNKDLTFRLDRILNAQRVKDSGINNQTEEFTVSENTDEVYVRDKTLIKILFSLVLLVSVFIILVCIIDSRFVFYLFILLLLIVIILSNK